MKRYAYPAYAPHKVEHDKFVAQVKQLQQDLRPGKAKISRDVLTFLQSRLIGHMPGMDKGYSGFLQAAEVK